ncbi:MAG TPA: rhodanese-like domain-containing protein [Gemmatimonadaceae bacterium]|nr:rhodanese-like domain-containing protein [Gemmatimonadaceae bacterium]
MLFTRYYDKPLAQASYLIGCQATREALIVDPNRDSGAYIAAAQAERMKIRYVTETHIHADYVSGSRELAKRTGAQLLLSGEGGKDWQYAFATSDNAKLLHDGDTFFVGNLRVDVMHTPGHTPEHLSFVVTDVPASPVPLLILTGDFVFVGDVGRPDLLEKAAKQANTMEEGARTLWKSLQRFRALPDHLQVWPGHGAGSACGKALGAVPSSTVGYEKLVNWGVSAPSEEVFVRGVLEGQPEPPAYFARMKVVNRDGPPILGDVKAPARLDAAGLEAAMAGGALAVDTRRGDAFAHGHVKGSVSVPLTGSFVTYSGSALPLDTRLVLITADDDADGAQRIARNLSLIGFDDIAGFAPAAALNGLLAEPLARLQPGDAIARQASGEPVIDVRNSSERAMGYIPGAKHVPFTELASRASELRGGSPILVTCQSGARSLIAASMLNHLGIAAVDAGGIDAWERAGGPVEGQRA